MSRIGRLPIPLPDKVEVSVKKKMVTVKGPRGEKELELPEGMKLDIEEGKISIERVEETPAYRRMHGTTRAVLANWVQGLSSGHQKILLVNGKGYQGEVNGQILEMQLGFSHKVLVQIPPGLDVVIQPGQNSFTITVTGNDKHLVGSFASELYRIKPVEPYNLIGMRYSDQFIRRKTVKTIT